MSLESIRVPAEYEVFASSSLATVRIQVQSLLDQQKGWLPHGPITIAMEKNKPLYAQTMVRWHQVTDLSGDQ